MEPTMSLPARWSLANLIAFRFFFVYFISYIIPFPLNILPRGSVIFQPLTDLALQFYEFVAKNLVNADYQPLSPNGSGDTTINYIQLLVFVTISFVATTVWSFMDGNRKNYEKLLQVLITLIRYYLAFTMINYGLIKVFRIQFPFITTDRLSQSYGESSPMGLLWTFMGYSTAYNIFIGLGEIAGGMLLLFRRTRLIGALVVVAIMSNVVMLNFTYDVPAKLFSMHLLAMATFILVPDVRRLSNLFLFNSVVEPDTSQVFYRSEKTKWYYVIGKGTIITLFLASHLVLSVDIYKQHQEYYKIQTGNSLTGQFEVESFILNGTVVSPGELDTRRWKKISMNPKTVDIQYMDGGSGPWHFNTNASESKVIIHSLDLWSTGSFAAHLNGESLTFEGNLDQDTVKITFRKMAEDKFPLVDRGFHWVSEYPFNR